MYYFSTYFDINYLPRALCLLDSLEKHCESFRVYALCLDDLCLELIKELGRSYVVPFGLSELEASNPALVSVKNKRSLIEYYYTCGPSFLSFLMDRFSEIDLLTYIDADLFFYSNPQPLFDQFKKHSIGVFPHHMPDYSKVTAQGKFNVGWINFRRDANGLACLYWWRDRCIEWCFERYEDGKYADQLYLDQWPELFDGFFEFTYKGANIGAWNVRDYQFSLKSGRVYVDEDPLIFYHFHGLKKMMNNLYNTSLGIARKPPSPILKEQIYAGYIELLEKYSMGRNPTSSIRNYNPKFYIIKKLAHLALGIMFRQYIIYYKGHVF